ncbi:hypothetical protein C5B91_12055 [Haloferax sp. Atlit-10N]|uniref:CopG family transcriptional regulator n=1 Tax=Haloferax prahovense (strain DSM 18310 / JCM 13924 / TL6) TaxID=1227461 RepID=M0G3V9_HALPT|nr:MULTISPECIES: hypothetical protein [Haloferax]ELZ66951.1 hypothetical protein C457_12979 [Haloferax prahovense DSM 18310]RDZ44253.1 hypothetical protein C5B87_08485 [Haloferax sp. Atlit-16N]RDZ47742.1 hypothetical protein C5B86_01415 [Haloferax sp. Atlit-19N]RDZ58297.1 hypothetical protein C5B91_12055 [Haloferax sp. Atlit-10N]
MEGEDGVSLPDDLRTWVEARADEEGVDPETVLARALGTYRLAVSDAGESLDGADAVSDRLGGVEARVDELEGELDEKISDVRMRVVQVKREADEKAPRDHTHPELDAELDRLADDVRAARNRVTDLDERVDAGFENFEEILTYLDETTATLDENLRTVARTLLDLRGRAADLEAAGLERQALAELLRTANAAGEKKARCEECDETVHLDLLAEPRCPSCRSPFRELSSSPGFFGSATLHTGRLPALESADDARATDEVADLLDEAITGVVDDATDGDDDRYASREEESAQQGAAAGSEHGDD